MGRLDQLQQKQTGGRLSQLQFETPPTPTIPPLEKRGFFKRTVSDVRAFVTGEVSVRDIRKEIPGAAVGVAKSFANTFVPAITNFFKTTGSIFGEGLAYAVDPEVRKQFKAGNLDILPTITETTQVDLAKTVIAAGFETAVYRSFPNIVKMKIATRGGAGALQGLGFAISDGLAKDKSAEEIIKSLPAFGVLGGAIGTITPYLLPLLKAELKVVPKEMKNVFKGLRREIRPLKPEKLGVKQEGEIIRIPISTPNKRYEAFLRSQGYEPYVPRRALLAPKGRLLLEKGITQQEPIILLAPREKLLLKAGIKPTVDPIKVPIYKKIKITKNTKLEKGDIISIDEIDKWVVTNVKKSRVTPRGKEQILELKDIKGNTFEESVLDLTGAVQIKKIGEKIPLVAKPAKIPTPKPKPKKIKPTVKPKIIPEKPVVRPEKIKEPELPKPVIKEVEPVAITEKRVIPVSREVLPVGEGKTRVSRLESRVKGTLDDVKPERADDAGITTFKQMNKKEQIRLASEFVDKNPDDAMAVLRGDKPAPKGILHNSIALALEEKAALGADANLALKLGSLRSTRAGQEISILTEANPSNPITKIAEIIKARVERATRRIGRNKTISGEKAKIQKEASMATAKEQIKIAEADKILKELTC